MTKKCVCDAFYLRTIFAARAIFLEKKNPSYAPILLLFRLISAIMIYPNKAWLFPVSFFQRKGLVGGGGQTDPPAFIFQEELN